MTTIDETQLPDAPARSGALPGGLLRLGPDGAILEAPRFLRDALNLHLRDVPSIFHVCDPANPPYLDLSRIFGHPYGATEYHVEVVGGFGPRRGFRYWHTGELEEGGVASFFIVDESATLQHQEWALRRLRREVLNDVQTALATHFTNRLAAVQALSEMLRDVPGLALETAPRLLAAVDELTRTLERVTAGTDTPAAPDFEDLPLSLTELPAIVGSWGAARNAVVCTLHDVDAGTILPTSSVERVLQPLVQNALDAVIDDAPVEVEIRELEDGFARIVVADSGEGMSEHVRRRAEDPFFTTRTGHLGLGLPHAREALRSAGGEWKIESSPGAGTRVTILLPVTTAAQLFR